jgi:filamentous hemagglutinin family protein
VRLGSCLVVASVLITSLPERVIAQITSDNTLPKNSSVTRDGNIFNITGGTQAGSNLFHSFSEFSVPTDGTAYFNNTVNIQNIISRVTGGSVSNIDGLIRTSGTANLFLINPSGIIFGANARLDVKGSFVATTANAIGFGDRGFFSASKTESSSSLLTINPSALLFNQIATAPIQNNSANLSVGNNLSLLQVGGNVDINGGSLNALGGRVELGGLAGEGIVGLNVNGNNLSLNFPSDGLPASVSLTNGARVNVASDGGGSIAVNAQNINILEGSSLRAGISPLAGFDGAQAGDVTLSAKGTVRIEDSSIYNAVFGLGNGGSLRVDAGKLIIQDGVVATATISSGKAGDLVVNTSDSIELTGSSSSTGTINIDIDVPINVFGISFNIPVPVAVPIGLFSASLNTRTLRNISGFLGSLPTASGNAGNLTIQTGRLIVSNGAVVSAATTSVGKGGNLTVKADLIELSGTSPNDSTSSLFSITSKLPSALRNDTDGLGSGGNLTIDTKQLIVRDGAWVITGTGNNKPVGGLTVTGGELIINATESVELSGTSSDNIPSALASGTQGAGNANKLVINTKKLMVSNGGIISAGTSSSGKGGELIINATDSVELVGTSKQGLSASQIQDFIGFGGALVSNFVEDRPFPSGVISGTANTGNAGNLTIDTGRLLIQGGAQASVSTINAGNAGDLNVRASSIELSGTSLENPKPNDIVGRSLLTTAVGEGSTGKGGNITVNTNSLTINDGAALTASTSGQKDAGDITLSANTLSILNDGQLRTSTFGSAQAGDITLNIPEIQLSGSTSGVFAQTSSTGPAGNLTLQPLNGQTLTINFFEQAQISASTSGSGKGGNLTLGAPESITLNGNGTLAATSEGVGSGRAGDVLLSTEKLTIANGMRVSAATNSINPAASGGNLTVQAAQLNLTNGSRLEAGTTGTAPGGNLTIQPNDNEQTLAVNFTGGATVSAASSGSGKGGTLNVNAPESINLTGNGSVISAETTAEGAGGDLTLTTGKLALQDGAKITVSSTGLGRAGDLKVNANSIYLNNAAKITADTTGGGGNIFMRSPLILLGNQSSVTTNAQGSGIPGGNINIDTDFLIAFKNSDINANSANFRGGNVRINAQVIFGTRFQNVASDSTSDITATGASPELSGSVEINTPDIDPNSGLVELPTIPVDTQVAQGCYSPGYAQSRFVITGRGGLPPNPQDILTPDAPQIDWVSLKPRNNNRSLPPVTSKTTTSTPSRIVEATGATLNAFGQIILSANSSTITPHTSRQKPIQCYGS